MMKYKRRVSLCLASVFILVLWMGLIQVGWADNAGILELIGVPDDVQGGSYDLNTGIFHADVSEIPGAEVQISYDEMQITGLTLEWHAQDDYFIFTNGAKLDRDDLQLTSNTLEYFGDEQTLIATGNVIVNIDDGTMRGQQFVMDLDNDTMQLFGPFQGEFIKNSNN